MKFDSPHWNNQEKLFRDIQIVSFAIDDIKLFLDTHPDNADALNYFRHYRNIMETMVEKYTQLYGPLTVNDTKAEITWEWVQTPWPWELED